MRGNHVGMLGGWNRGTVGSEGETQSILQDMGMLEKRVFLQHRKMESGGDLLSRAVTSQVPSACGGLTSVFGMGTGGTLQP